MQFASDSNLSSTSHHSKSNKVKEIPSNKSESRIHSNFFYIYFLFSYYIGFVPFRFRYDRHQCTFTIHSWYLQKIFCAIIHTIVLLRYALEIKKVHYSIKPNDPIAYFQLIERCSSFLYKLVAFHHFWKKKDVFFKIIKLLEKSTLPKYNPYKIQTTFFLSSVCSFYILISLFRLLFDPAIIQSSTLMDQSWYRSLVIESRYSYLISNGEPQVGPISAFDTFMAIITAINIQFRIMAGFYLDLCVLICVLSLWAPVMGYVTSLNSSIETLKYAEFTNDKNVIEKQNELVVKIGENTVISQFKLLKSLSTLICEAIGGFLVPAISEIAFGYAIDFEEAILTNSYMRRFTNLLFYASTFSILIFAAEICRKLEKAFSCNSENLAYCCFIGIQQISCVKTWLCVNENNLRISRNELMMILDNVAHDEICINAGGRVTINYSFVGTLIIVLITFFIIRLQSELSPSN